MESVSLVVTLNNFLSLLPSQLVTNKLFGEYLLLKIPFFYLAFISLFGPLPDSLSLPSMKLVHKLLYSIKSYISLLQPVESD